jgi:hypothetical protein
VHHDPAPPGPPGADAQPTIPTQTPQNAPAGTHTGTGPRADAQARPQAADVHPLTALSDPENVGWVPVVDDEDDGAFTQWHECEVELWEGEYLR